MISILLFFGVLILFVGLPCLLILGLIKPGLLNLKSRKLVLLYWFISSLSMFIFIGFLVSTDENNKNNEIVELTSKDENNSIKPGTQELNTNEDKKKPGKEAELSKEMKNLENTEKVLISKDKNKSQKSILKNARIKENKIESGEKNVLSGYNENATKNKMKLSSPENNNSEESILSNENSEKNLYNLMEKVLLLRGFEIGSKSKNGKGFQTWKDSEGHIFKLNIVTSNNNLQCCWDEDPFKSFCAILTPQNKLTLSSKENIEAKWIDEIKDLTFLTPEIELQLEKIKLHKDKIRQSVELQKVLKFKKSLEEIEKFAIKTDVWNEDIFQKFIIDKDPDYDCFFGLDQAKDSINEYKKVQNKLINLALPSKLSEANRKQLDQALGYLKFAIHDKINSLNHLYEFYKNLKLYQNKDENLLLKWKDEKLSYETWKENAFSIIDQVLGN